jgi:hypothetical protein
MLEKMLARSRCGGRVERRGRQWWHVGDYPDEIVIAVFTGLTGLDWHRTGNAVSRL